MDYGLEGEVPCSRVSDWLSADSQPSGSCLSGLLSEKESLHPNQFDNLSKSIAASKHVPSLLNNVQCLSSSVNSSLDHDDQLLAIYRLALAGEEADAPLVDIQNQQQIRCSSSHLKKLGVIPSLSQGSIGLHSPHHPVLLLTSQASPSLRHDSTLLRPEPPEVKELAVVDNWNSEQILHMTNSASSSPSLTMNRET
ncbi:unnamed protein product [Protopolystoma xenopodis]|uniref:Uncharacterized protein n=1 Tax=Protopolystoma xenopodis TaxID=117903 RepID=A0A448WGQ4_9PLAT|nr:unnamed protein product [Protopolystoma xenopodis]